MGEPLTFQIFQNCFLECESRSVRASWAERGWPLEVKNYFLMGRRTRFQILWPGFKASLNFLCFCFAGGNLSLCFLTLKATRTYRTSTHVHGTGVAGEAHLMWLVPGTQSAIFQMKLSDIAFQSLPLTVLSVVACCILALETIFTGEINHFNDPKESIFLIN